MKKVLILAYDFPPYNSIGAQRPASWLKYLKQFGWQPIVVTRHWDADIKNEIDYIKPSKKITIEVEESDEGTVIRVPFIPNLRDRIILKYGMGKMVMPRKAFTFFLQLFRFRMPQLDATFSIYQAAKDYLTSNKVDLIIATGEPFILFLHAQKLSKKFNIPYLLDYRDCWTNAPHIAEMGLLDKWLHETHFRKIEKHVVKKAEMLTAAAPSYAKKLRLLHEEKNIQVLLNGFFPFASQTKITLEQVFTISYAGIFYAHQRLEIFLKGFNLLVDRYPKNKFSLRFYGLSFYPEMVERVKKSCSSKALGHIVFTERIPYDVLQARLRSSHILLLLSAKDANWLNAKIFDYLQASRKILLVENDQGILEQIINECQAGVTADTPEEVAALLELYYQEWVETGELKHQTVNYEQFSRENQTKRLAELLDKYVG